MSRVSDLLPKGGRGNPFFLLKHDFKDEVLRLDPYPIVNDGGQLGPRLHLKEIWPDLGVDEGQKTIDSPMGFVYVQDPDRWPSFPWKTFRSDLINAALQAEREFSFSSHIELNACLVHTPIYKSRLVTYVTGEKAETERTWAYPVHFYMVEVEVPGKHNRHAWEVKVLQGLGLLR